jgi:Cdc6-like AAA superfamily ATPase
MGVVSEEAQCRVCGRELEKVEPLRIGGKCSRIRPSLCWECELSMTKEGVKHRQSKGWENLCPIGYQNTSLEYLRGQLREGGYGTSWLMESLGWQYGSRGLVICGDTGTGKTRTMWQLLRRLIDEERREVAIFNAVKFRTEVQVYAREGRSREWAKRMSRVEVLYWDDLGQVHWTGAASEMFLHLIEERTAAQKPILATTQYSGEEIDQQFERKEMGQAVRRRLNEFCKVITIETNERNH